MFVSSAKSLYLCTRKTKTSLLEDPLAQLVEHNTFNVGVLGSSPKRITERVLVRVSFLCFYILFVKYWAFLSPLVWRRLTRLEAKLGITIDTQRA